MGKSELPSTLQELKDLIPEGVRLSKGARRRIARATASGLPPTEITRRVLKAASHAENTGRTKVGAFGNQKKVFDDLDLAARLTELDTRRAHLVKRDRRRLKRGW